MDLIKLLTNLENPFKMIPINTTFKMTPSVNCNKDCMFTQGRSSTTLAYYAPIYDKNGVNVNPDRNTTYSDISCVTCSRKWKTQTTLGVTKYEEIISNEK